MGEVEAELPICQTGRGSMKDIRIFVASSKELIAERNQLAFLVLSMEEVFAARGLRVRLAKWKKERLMK